MLILINVIIYLVITGLKFASSMLKSPSKSVCKLRYRMLILGYRHIYRVPQQRYTPKIHLSVPRDELIKAVDVAISRQLEERRFSFKKVRNSHPGHSQVTIVS
jgi:hypothetical protein